MTISQTTTTTTCPSADIAAVFRDAADRVRKYGWAQDDPRDYAPRAELTASDAIEDAAVHYYAAIHGQASIGTAGCHDAAVAAMDALAGYLLMTGQMDFCSYRGLTLVMAWNDAEGRTKADVVAALSFAADILAVHGALAGLMHEAGAA